MASSKADLARLGKKAMTTERKKVECYLQASLGSLRIS